MGFGDVLRVGNRAEGFRDESTEVSKVPFVRFAGPVGEEVCEVVFDDKRKIAVLRYLNQCRRAAGNQCVVAHAAPPHER